MGNWGDERFRDVKSGHSTGVSLPMSDSLRAIHDHVTCRDELNPHQLIGAGLVQVLVLAVLTLNLLLSLIHI